MYPNISGTASASSTLGSASLRDGMPSARLKISNGRAQSGFASSSGAFARGAGGGKCSSARACAPSSAAASRCPEKSLVQPVIQQKCSPDSSARTFSITHCSLAASPSAARSSCVAERSSRSATSLDLLAVERRQARRDVALGLAGVDLEPCGRVVYVPLEERGLLRERQHVVLGADA